MPEDILAGCHPLPCRQRRRSGPASNFQRRLNEGGFRRPYTGDRTELSDPPAMQSVQAAVTVEQIHADIQRASPGMAGS
jgi:hypothetical protein